MRSRSAALLFSLVWLVGCTAAPTDEPTVSARDIILFIGDGVDHHQLSIARKYLHGHSGSFSFDHLEHLASARVATLQEADPQRQEWVGDSASGGTALSAGVVTSRGRIATNAGSGTPVTTIFELARDVGWRTGIVTTSSLTDATPASFYAHIRSRFCEGPEDMDRAYRGLLPGCPESKKSGGGPGSIVEQLADFGLDVALGGGGAKLAERDEQNRVILERMKTQGYQVALDATELEAASAERVLGLFGEGHLAVEWRGEGGARARPLDVDSNSQPLYEEPFACEGNPDRGPRPTLGAMTERSLDLLSRGGEDRPGFLLMVESASIDKQAHAASPCGQIGETKALDEAVQAALSYQERHPGTLIVVTSDHGHSGQIVPHPSLFAATARGVPQHPAGKVALVRTPEGSVLGVTYGTNVGFLEEHTGTQIPVYAQGPGAERVQGFMEQADIFAVLREAMGL